MYLFSYIGYSLGIEVEILFFTYIKMLLHLDLESSMLLFYYYCVNWSIFQSDKIHPKSVSNITAKGKGAFKICICQARKSITELETDRKSFPSVILQACNLELGWRAVYFMSYEHLFLNLFFAYLATTYLVTRYYFFLAWLLLIRVDCWLLNHLWVYTLEVPISFEK